MTEHVVGGGVADPNVYGGLDAGTLYYYRVMSANAANLHSAWGTGTFTTLP